MWSPPFAARFSIHGRPQNFFYQCYTWPAGAASKVDTSLGQWGDSFTKYRIPWVFSDKFDRVPDRTPNFKCDRTPHVPSKSHWTTRVFYSFSADKPSRRKTMHLCVVFDTLRAALTFCPGPPIFVGRHLLNTRTYIHKALVYLNLIIVN